MNGEVERATKAYNSAYCNTKLSGISVSAPPKADTIQSHLQSLENNVGNLLGDLGDMQARLQPVMRPDNVALTAESKALFNPSEESDISVIVQRIMSVVDMCRENISDTLTRLQL